MPIYRGEYEPWSAESPITWPQEVLGRRRVRLAAKRIVHLLGFKNDLSPYETLEEARSSLSVPFTLELPARLVRDAGSRLKVPAGSGTTEEAIAHAREMLSGQNHPAYLYAMRRASELEHAAWGAVYRSHMVQDPEITVSFSGSDETVNGFSDRLEPQSTSMHVRATFIPAE